MLTWVVAVMLPPMAIFFPLFTLLEDFGILPRIAFNLDEYFEKNGSCGKQALTMCMGIGCNAVGVTGSRIIDSKKERIISILTNSFIPCNGRFPTLIILFTMFISVTLNGMINTLINVLILTLIIVLSILITLLSSRILSKTILKKEISYFLLELPLYRKPQIIKTLVRSLIDRTLKILLKAIAISAPTGLIIWILNNVNIGDISIINILVNFFNNYGLIIGLDGIIITSFVLGFPANEIVFPIMLMIYSSSSSLTSIENVMYAKNLLLNNGWNIITVICTIVFVVFHFPCSSTLMTIYKETKSFKWTLLSFVLPLTIGTILCSIINLFNFI